MKNSQNYLCGHNGEEIENNNANHTVSASLSSDNVLSPDQHWSCLLPRHLLEKWKNADVSHLRIPILEEGDFYMLVNKTICKYGKKVNAVSRGVSYVQGVFLSTSEIGTIKGGKLHGLGQKDNEIGFYKQGSHTGIELSLEDKVLVYRYVDTLKKGEFNEDIISQISQLEEKYDELLKEKEEEKRKHGELERLVSVYQLSSEDIKFYKEMTEYDERVKGVILYFLLDPRGFTYNEIKEKIQTLLQTQSLGRIQVDLSYGGLDGLHTLEYQYLTTFTLNELKELYHKNPEKFLRFYRFTNDGTSIDLSFSRQKDAQFFIDQYGMNKYELEQYFFIVYTGRYFELQEGGSRGNENILRVVLTHEMIRKLPKFEGIVYRGLEFSNTEDRGNFIKNFSGKITGVENFSTNKEHALGFLGDSEASVLLEVHTKNAHYLGVSPDYDDGRGYFDDVENHAWFEVGTELEVVEIVEKDGLLQIILKDRESNVLSK